MCWFRNYLCIFVSVLVLLSCSGCETANCGTQQSMLPITTAPTEPVIYDSLNIPESESSLVREKPEEKIIRVFDVPLNVLTDEGAIRKIASDGIIAYYVVYELSSESASFIHVKQKCIVDGAMTDCPFASRGYWEVFMEYAIEPRYFFDAGVEVKNIYCLEMPYSYDAPLIFYSTDRGDFVLYYDCYACQEMYLFPAEVYYNIEKKVPDVIYREIPPGGGGYRFHIGMVWDIEPYRIDPPENFLQRVE